MKLADLGEVARGERLDEDVVVGGGGHCAEGTWDPSEGLMCGRVGNTRAPIGSRKPDWTSGEPTGEMQSCVRNFRKWKSVHVIAGAVLAGMLAFVPCGEGEQDPWWCTGNHKGRPGGRAIPASPRARAVICPRRILGFHPDGATIMVCYKTARQPPPSPHTSFLYSL